MYLFLNVVAVIFVVMTGPSDFAVSCAFSAAVFVVSPQIKAALLVPDEEAVALNLQALDELPPDVRSVDPTASSHSSSPGDTSTRGCCCSRSCCPVSVV